MDYTADNWKLRAYYEHFFEDHSQMLGVSWVSDCNGVTRFLSYHPWQDGLWGIELDLPRGKWLKSIVTEYITSRDQSGPILHNTNANFKEQISGFDYYYNHYFFQSWQHWGMSVCNPQLLSPSYNEDGYLYMPNTRVRSFYIGVEGQPLKEWAYRIMSSYIYQWRSFLDTLEEVKTVSSTLFQISYNSAKLQNWKFSGALAADCSSLIGNNVGGRISIVRTGFLQCK